MMSRRHYLMTNEFTLWDLKELPLLGPVASHMDTGNFSAKLQKLLSVSRLSWLFWNTVYSWQVSKIICVQCCYFPVSSLYCFRSIFVFAEAFVCKPLITCQVPTLSINYLLTKSGLYGKLLYGTGYFRYNHARNWFRSTFGSFNTFFWAAYMTLQAFTFPVNRILRINNRKTLHWPY